MNPNKNLMYIQGAVAGLLVGLLSVYFYNRAAEEKGGFAQKPAAMSVHDMVKIGLSVLGVVRLIAEVGAGKGKES
jgi:hypothetical protein